MNYPTRSPLIPSLARALTLTLAATAMACGATSTPLGDGNTPTDAALSTDAPASSTECVAVPRTCADVMATFASNSTSVTVECDAAAGTFTVRSTGVPNYTSNQTTPNAIREQGWVVVYPLQPACAAQTTSVLNSRGPIGIMINGVPFYGPQDAEGRDALVFEGPTFDDCDGHADQGCSYHYHVEPVCVFGERDTAAQHRMSDGHPAVIGYANDGFAIHASYPSTDPAATLDTCQGHSDPVRGYHYHATSASPYLLGCYHGTGTARLMATMNLCTTGMTMTPRACTATADCTGACPAGSMGCACATGMTGAMVCLPTCTMDSDCPTTPMGMLRCDTARGACAPR